MTIAIICLGVLALIILIAGIVGAIIEDDGEIFGAAFFCTVVCCIPIIVLLVIKSNEGDAVKRNDNLQQVLRYAERGQEAYALAHEGRLTTKIIDLQAYEPQLTRYLADTDVSLRVEMASNGQAAKMVASITGDRDNVFYSMATLKTGDMQFVRACSIDSGGGCDDQTWE